jgi:hypothetical protein
VEAADANPEPDDSSAETKAADKPKQSRAAQVVKVVKDIADAADPRPSRKPPTADEWEKPMARGLVYLSVFYIWWLTTDDDGNEIHTDDYTLDDERAELIVPPFARIFSKTAFNRRYGRDIIENFDVLVSVVAIVTYVMDTRVLWSKKRERAQARASNNNVIPMRREQTKTVAAQPKQQTQAAATVVEPKAQEIPKGENDAEPKQDDAGPYKRPLEWTPGQQHSAD